MANDPFHRLPEVPSFALTSTDVTDGEPLPGVTMSGLFGVPGGEDRSPQLSWSGAPEGTKGYAVTMYDPDAPTQSGFWHWAVYDLPASVTELAAGAGDEGGPGLPDGAVQLKNDAGGARFLGAAPPAGHGSHRYVFAVHALDTESLAGDGVTPDSTPAFLGFVISGHILGRAVLTATAEITG
ncbi:YbhB/YbcL family Raf kinase inhibitor-like protein [Baekduia soli]|uniref:YbhB/YbcL family Raf kinase inhibitor-like protein n=1 Tax=Baekduia soli TaxID=496014 RepID=A0A5B8UBM9_9ACTN|nr:YbhB/YbcL family Raf kinase inhibitor-like protein [Baekduia soli]QEC50394.1 YbhB/YbcL family Raf kinase inhibitor-like protein [Baekduia soli]